jgi:hypothetical protein
MERFARDIKIMMRAAMMMHDAVLLIEHKIIWRALHESRGRGAKENNRTSTML